MLPFEATDLGFQLFHLTRWLSLRLI
jgi:hypothetical protein